MNELLVDGTTDFLLARRIAAAHYLHGVSDEELEQLFAKPEFDQTSEEMKQTVHSELRRFYQGVVITPSLERLAQLTEPPTVVWVVFGAVVTAKRTREEAVVAAIAEGQWRQVSENRWESGDDYVEVRQIEL